MWKNEFFFFFIFLLILASLFTYTDRMLKFLIYLEVYSVFILFYITIYVGIYDYSVILKILILVACESALGLSILVSMVRNFSLDKITSKLYKKCEGF